MSSAYTENKTFNFAAFAMYEQSLEKHTAWQAKCQYAGQKTGMDSRMDCIYDDALPHNLEHTYKERRGRRKDFILQAHRNPV